MTDAPMFEIVKHVTLPLLKFGNDPIFVRFDDAIFKAEEMTAGRETKNEDGTTKVRMAPPELANVTDLVRNIPCQIIVNTVLGSELRKKYPSESYVGKSFRLSKAQLQGKRYATFEIAEVRVKSDAPTVDAVAHAQAKRR